ncbi:MAG: hypothetical protein AAF393_00090 [Pseudomonadota bacterium]
MWRMLIVLLLLSPQAFAAGDPPKIVALAAGLDIRESPPNGGAWSYPGPVKAVTKKDQRYVILRKVMIQQGFRSTEWTQVAPVDANNAVIPNQSGWVLIQATRSLTAKPVITDLDVDLDNTRAEALQREIEAIIKKPAAGG